ncbi:MAG: cupin domain-containing protein [Pseudomonadota bacterium]
MPNAITVDVGTHSLDLGRDLTITPRARQPGPPHRIDGVTLGIVTMTENAPHAGEVHPDGDELLYVISGRVRVTCDSALDAPLELGPGMACIVPRGEWHRVDILEPAELLHSTPGPNGDHRPLDSA